MSKSRKRMRDLLFYWYWIRGYNVDRYVNLFMSMIITIFVIIVNYRSWLLLRVNLKKALWLLLKIIKEEDMYYGIDSNSYGKFKGIRI